MPLRYQTCYAAATEYTKTQLREKSTEVPQNNTNNTRTLKDTMNSTKNPYEADADKISQDDRFYDVPLYGRYLPWEGEFKPEKRHINSKRPESLEYWENVLRMCVEKRRVCPGSNGARDVFALGSVIIKSSHLKPPIEAIACRDYSFSDANEVNALRLAREVLKDIQVPEIFFAGKVNMSLIYRMKVDGYI